MGGGRTWACTTAMAALSLGGTTCPCSRCSAPAIPCDKQRCSDVSQPASQVCGGPTLSYLLFEGNLGGLPTSEGYQGSLQWYHDPEGRYENPMRQVEGMPMPSAGDAAAEGMSTDGESDTRVDEGAVCASASRWAPHLAIHACVCGPRGRFARLSELLPGNEPFRTSQKFPRLTCVCFGHHVV